MVSTDYADCCHSRVGGSESDFRGDSLRESSRLFPSPLAGEGSGEGLVPLFDKEGEGEI